MTCLCIDVGNSDTSMALQQNGQWAWFERVATSRMMDRQHLKLWFQKQSARVDQVVLASVVPKATQEFKKALEEHWPQTKLLVAEYRQQNWIKLAYEQPEKIGIDRVVGMVYAARQWPDCAVLYIDLGTASTADLVVDRVHLGGAIAPGLKMALHNFSQYAVQLPHIELQKTELWGKNTEDCMRSGVIYSTVAWVKELQTALQKQFPHKKVWTVMSGGYALLIGAYVQVDVLDEQWMVKSLYDWHLNQKGLD